MAVQSTGCGCSSIHDHFGADPASSQNPADRCPADLQSPGALGFADTVAMQFPDFRSVGGLFVMRAELAERVAESNPSHKKFHRWAIWLRGTILAAELLHEVQSALSFRLCRLTDERHKASSHSANDDSGTAPGNSAKWACDPGRMTRNHYTRIAWGHTFCSVWLVLRDALVMIAAGIAIALPCVWAGPPG
jgi:hypothetical protein